jgi:hypothetical protein
MYTFGQMENVGSLFDEVEVLEAAITCELNAQDTDAATHHSRDSSQHRRFGEGDIVSLLRYHYRQARRKRETCCCCPRGRARAAGGIAEEIGGRETRVSL